MLGRKIKRGTKIQKNRQVIKEYEENSNVYNIILRVFFLY